jgi:hypothetical protein
LFVKEGRFLDLTIEAFNLFNRGILLGINIILGAACTTHQSERFAPCTADPGTTQRLTHYNLRGRRDRKPTEPLGFSTDADTRQLQLGVRIPQVSRYYMPATKADGAPIPASCKPRFSTLGKDTRFSPDVLLMAEYCNTTDTPCDLDSTYGAGLGGRLYRWPLDSGNRLAASGGYVSPEKIYIMNERNVQGMAPIMTEVDSAYLPDTYWLSSTRRSGALFRVSQTSPAKAWYADESNFPWIPEGLHATASGTNLWVATEGRRDSGGNLITNPVTGGRVVIFIAQSSVD